MTRVKVTYLAMDEEKIPIASAATFEDLKAALDIYYGVQSDSAKCEGWFPYDSKYPDEYEGYYKYSWHMNLDAIVEAGTDTVKVYCVDFYPHTVYDDKEEQKKLITELMNGDDILDLAKEAWEGCDGCTEADKQMYISGFIAGYNRK